MRRRHGQEARGRAQAARGGPRGAPAAGGWSAPDRGVRRLPALRGAGRGGAQALNDFLVFGTTAAASFLAGSLQERLGWHPLNWFSVALVAVAAVAVGWLRLQRQPLHAST